MKELDLFGKWWIPGQRNESVAGRLNFDPADGGELDLLDPLNFSRPEWNSTIFGRAGGDDITLRNCRLSHSPFDQEDEVSHLLPQIILLDQFVGYTRSFTRVDVEYPLLERWASLPLGNVEESPDEHVFTYDPHGTTAGKTEIDGVEIRLDSTRRRSVQPCERMAISNSAKFVFETSSAVPLDQFSDYILDAERLLSLGLNDPVHPEKITARDDNDQDPIQVEVFMPLSQYDDRHTPTLHHTYFTFVELNDDIGTVLTRWFADRKDGRILRNLYFGPMYNNRMFEQNRLLSLVSAMESYHDLALFPDDQVVLDDVFTPIKNGLRCLVSDTDLEGRVNGLIKHVINDISIKNKIRKFMYEYESIIANLSDEENYDHAEMIETVASSAADARHKIAHGSPEDYELEGVGGTTDWLQIAIEACLLDLVGVEEERIWNQIRINYVVRVDEITLPPLDT